MIWMLTIISSCLWAFFSVILLSSAMSIVAIGDQVYFVKTFLIILSIVMAVFAVYMLLTALKIKRRAVSLRLHKSLMSYLLSGRYKISLIQFAEENNAKILTAQKFIDTLIEPFGGKIDIDVNGIIIYNNNDFSNKFNRKVKKDAGRN